MFAPIRCSPGPPDLLMLVPASAYVAPRLRLGATGIHRCFLDGGWWPRSSDPATELPGLILALDAVHGRVVRLILSAGGWAHHPHHVVMSRRSVRIDYFASQPTDLLTAMCVRGDRIDLLVVASGTARGVAEKAMAVAATTGNHVVASYPSGPHPTDKDPDGKAPWKAESEYFGSLLRSPLFLTKNSRVGPRA